MVGGRRLCEMKTNFNKGIIFIVYYLNKNYQLPKLWGPLCSFVFLLGREVQLKRVRSKSIGHCREVTLESDLIVHFAYLQIASANFIWENSLARYLHSIM